MIEKDFEEPFNAWKKTPGPDTSDALLKAVSPVLDSAIQTYGAGDRGPLLRSRARRLALKAFQSYNPEQAKLKTHLMSQLQSLRRVKAQQNQIISLPEQVQLDQHFLHNAHRSLSDELGREPSDAELASHTGLSLKRIGHIRGASGGLSEGQASFIGEGGELTAPAITDDGSGWQQFVYFGLPPRDQFIMEHLLGMHNRKVIPAKDIAKKLRITPAAVAQRAAKIQTMLNQRQNLGVL